jgi:hypothetical protein
VPKARQQTEPGQLAEEGDREALVAVGMSTTARKPSFRLILMKRKQHSAIATAKPQGEHPAHGSDAV